MADKKVTKKEMFAEVIRIIEGSGAENAAECVDFLNHEVELLNNRKSSSKPSPVQKANEKLAQVVKTVLSEQESAVTVTDLMKDARLATYTVEKADGATVEEMTNQKLSSVLKKLVDAHEVNKDIIKKKAYFSMPQ